MIDALIEKLEWVKNNVLNITELYIHQDGSASRFQLRAKIMGDIDIPVFDNFGFVDKPRSMMDALNKALACFFIMWFVLDLSKEFRVIFLSDDQKSGILVDLHEAMLLWKKREARFMYENDDAFFQIKLLQSYIGAMLDQMRFMPYHCNWAANQAMRVGLLMQYQERYRKRKSPFDHSGMGFLSRPSPDVVRQFLERISAQADLTPIYQAHSQASSDKLQLLQDDPRYAVISRVLILPKRQAPVQSKTFELISEGQKSALDFLQLLVRSDVSLADFEADSFVEMLLCTLTDVESLNPDLPDDLRNLDIVVAIAGVIIVYGEKLKRLPGAPQVDVKILLQQYSYLSDAREVVEGSDSLVDRVKVKLFFWLYQKDSGLDKCAAEGETLADRQVRALESEMMEQRRFNIVITALRQVFQASPVFYRGANLFYIPNLIAIDSKSSVTCLVHFMVWIKKALAEADSMHAEQLARCEQAHASVLFSLLNCNHYCVLLALWTSEGWVFCLFDPKGPEHVSPLLKDLLECLKDHFGSTTKVMVVEEKCQAYGDGVSCSSGALIYLATQSLQLLKVQRPLEASVPVLPCFQTEIPDDLVDQPWHVYLKPEQKEVRHLLVGIANRSIDDVNAMYYFLTKVMEGDVELLFEVLGLDQESAQQVNFSRVKVWLRERAETLDRRELECDFSLVRGASGSGVDGEQVHAAGSQDSSIVVPFMHGWC